MLYRFGDCQMDTGRLELRRAGAVCPLEPQVFDLLRFLIENRARVVSKDDLVNAVWGGRAVSDATLTSRISTARQAVGDDGEKQAVIRTFQRRGLRFVAEVEELAPGDAPPAAASGTASPDQTIRFCTGGDGTRLAYALSGSGPPLLKAANWLNHLEYDWESPVWRDLFAVLSSHHRLLRYDTRGTGLSDWTADDISFPAFCSDLDAVIAASGIATPFALMGISQGAAVAVDYAARHPDRVSHLVLWDGYVRGRNRRSTEQRAQSAAILTLMRQGWGRENPAFRQMFTSMFLPGATAEQVQWFTDLQRITTSPDNAVRIRSVLDDIDVSDRLAGVRARTLILHARDEAVVPLDEARFMAARIANARFVLLDSANHMVLPQEPAWQRAVDEILRFLKPG